MRIRQLKQQAAGSALFVVGLALGTLAGKPEFEWAVWAACVGIALFSGVRAVQYLYTVRRGPGGTWQLHFGEIRAGQVRDWNWLVTDEHFTEYEALCEAMLPEHGYPPVSTLKKKIARNAQIVWGIYETRNGLRRLEGCFVAYPLRQDALSQFLDFSWTNGRSVTEHHITRSWRKARATYIAAVVSRGTPAAAAVVDEIHRFVRAHSSTPVLARAATTEGARIMRKFGFLPIRSTDDVWIRQIPH